jgi:serine-type D-Ala-D-Ala carboxypeptidase/endopeptidase (penicillin-binding protein 4)
MTARFVLGLVWTLSLAPPAVLYAQATSALPDPVRTVIERPEGRRAHWGIAVRDAATGAPLLLHNADRLFIPASNLKLVIAAAAAHYLDPEFRYVTALLATGDIADGTLRGDLIVRGSGDPTISGRYYGDMLAVWESLADSLLTRGVRRIDGAIVADESHWDSEHVRGDWESYDLLWWYAAPVGALGFNDNAIDFSVAPAAIGRPATITSRPQTSFFVLTNRTVTAPAGTTATLDFTRIPGTDTIVAYGEIPADAARRTEYFAVADPARYAATVFAETLARRGISVRNPHVSVIRGASPLTTESRVDPGARTLVEHRSVPLPRLIAPVLQTSQNWFAEQLLKTIAREVGGEGSWTHGLELERRFLIDVVGIDSTAFRLRDASGLSAGSLITPDALLQLLRHMQQQPRLLPALDAMPVAGATTGSLRRRLEDLNGRVAAKTGSISNVDALSGFLTTAGGRRVVFSIIVNGSGRPSSAMRPLLDDVVRALSAAF